MVVGSGSLEAVVVVGPGSLVVVGSGSLEAGFESCIF